MTAPSDFKLDPRTYDRGLSCVHCGLCLPVCPTYTQNGLEADSPRGRIQLMLGLHEGKIEPTETVRHHLDLCLDCRACETACPSNVVYHEMIEETRSRLPPAKQSLSDRVVRWTFLNVMTRPLRLKLALLGPRLLQRVGVYPLLRKIGLFRILPGGLRKMEAMLPDAGPVWPGKPPERTLAGKTAAPPASVAFFSGCIGSVMFDRINRKAIELLSAAGCNVTCHRAETCCGAIHHHNGLHAPAEEMARRNIDALSASGQPLPDFIVTTIAGCGAMLRDYGTLLRDDTKYAARAKAFAARVRDITEVLAERGLPEMKHPVNATATYHDACHLAHAQRVTVPPRSLLAAVAGLHMVPLPESDMCCGAAGTYNLQHPEMAGDLAARKLKHIAATGASICIAGNVGCSMQIQSTATAAGNGLRVLHPVEVLHQAVFGPT